MAIYTASYFEPTHQHGRLIAISHSIPKGFKVQKQLKFLAPAPELLQDWQQGQTDQGGYIRRYRAQINADWKQVKQWLESLKTEPDMTLLCWERKGEFCHRNIVAQLLQKHRPECWGGRDVLKVVMPLCPKCFSTVYPGLDNNYCPRCRSWFPDWQVQTGNSTV